MTDTIPSYLRIHRGPDSADPSPADPGRTAIEQFWSCFSDATHWRVDVRSDAAAKSVELLPAVFDSPDQEPTVAVSQLEATRLAEAAMELLEQLEQSREQVRLQNAELAVRPSILCGSGEQQTLRDRLQQTLADAVAACDCTTAALYLLDDDTEVLTARSIYGLPANRLEESPRALRGSRADLEAMVQGVVAIDNLQESPIDTWNCPETSDVAKSAICAVINSDDIPIGTLWLFHDQTSKFTAAHQAAARMAANQLSLQLQSAASKAEAAPRQDKPVLREVAQWQCETLPIGTTLADGWFVDGMIESPQPWATGWHAWDVLPDGSLMFAIAEAIDPTVKGALSAAIAQAALTAHAGYRHTPEQLLQRINDTLWQTSTCEQLMSVLYLQVDPESGEGEFAAAGSIAAMIGSRYGYRPLVDGRGQPLCSDFRANYVHDCFRLMPGETLLAYGPGMEIVGADQAMMGDGIRSAIKSGERSPLASLRRQLAAMPLVAERGAAALVRGF